MTERLDNDRSEASAGAFLGQLGELVSAVQTWIDGHRAEIDSVLRWFEEHREEIEAFAVWGAVQRACAQTGLYAPFSPAWEEIAAAVRRAEDRQSLEAIMLSAYAPGGTGHAALVDELRTAPLLQSRLGEVNEIVESLADGRHYSTICGTLPLVEGVLADAHGKWQRSLDKYPIRKRLEESGTLTSQEEANLLLNVSALDMVLAASETTWKIGRITVGAVTPDLNRHYALHGTARGWDSAENATHAVLLLAAAARVAGPLLAPRPRAAASGT